MTTDGVYTWRSDCWNFQFRWLNRLQRSHLSDGLRQLAAISQQDFSPLGSLFGRFYSAQCGGWRFVVVESHTRPPKRQIIAFDKDMVCLPTSSLKDKTTLLRALGIDTIDDAIVFNQMTKCDYGVLHKKCAPVILRDLAAANQCGIQSLAEYHEFLEQKLMLCWQEWGGFLYAFKIDFSVPDTFVFWKQVGVAVGSFRRLPASLVR